ncbi:hypothetical protein BH10PSE17_BH10PSE17_09170 [soil metagenome]
MKSLDAMPSPSLWRLSLPCLVALLVAYSVAGERWTTSWPTHPHLVAYLVLAGAGLLAGLLAGMLGIGGALITIPALYLALPLLDVSADQLPALAVTCALLTMLPSTLVALWRQHHRNTLSIDWLRRLAIPMLLGAGVGALLATQLKGPILAMAFAAQSLYYGARLIADCGRPEGAPTRGITRGVSQFSPWAIGPLMAACASCLGMGGGSMVSPYLQHRGLPLRQATATASGLNICIALGGAAALILFAQESSHAVSISQWQAPLILGAASVLAVPLGVALGHKLPPSIFQIAIGSVNIVAGLALAGQVLL